MNAPSTSWLVKVTVDNKWVDDGFDLNGVEGAERLRDCLLKADLSYASSGEVEVSHVPDPTRQLKLNLLTNAITEAMRNIEANPGDSPQDIFNESLKSWETGLRMNHRCEIDQADLDAAFDANRR